MAKLHVELDGPRLNEVIILKDGEPLHNVAQLHLVLDADSEPIQQVTLGQLAVMDGQVYSSTVTHTISKATLTLEYVEA